MDINSEAWRVTHEEASTSRDLPASALAGPSLPAAGKVTVADALFLRLIDVTNDPGIRNYLRRIVAVADGPR